MQKNQILALIALTLLALSGTLRAEISIDELVEQARIAEGDVAVRDLPRWQGARKILIRDIGMDMSGIVGGFDGIEFIVTASASDAMQYASELDAIIGFCDPDLIAAARNLVWVQIYWAGAERCLSVDDIGGGDVVMTNMQKMSSPVIAEHAIAMMLSLARHLPQFVRAMEGGK